MVLISPGCSPTCGEKAFWAKAVAWLSLPNVRKQLGVIHLGLIIKGAAHAQSSSRGQNHIFTKFGSTLLVSIWIPRVNNIHSSLAMIDQFVTRDMAVIGLRSNDHFENVRLMHIVAITGHRIWKRARVHTRLDHLGIPSSYVP